MKTIQIRLADETGKIYRWRIQRELRAINCTIGKPTRVVSGWNYTDHDGYVRFVEGSWIDLLPHFKRTAENYGLTLMSELS